MGIPQYTESYAYHCNGTYRCEKCNIDITSDKWESDNRITCIHCVTQECHVCHKSGIYLIRGWKKDHSILVCCKCTCQLCEFCGELYSECECNYNSSSSDECPACGEISGGDLCRICRMEIMSS